LAGSDALEVQHQLVARRAASLHVVVPARPDSDHLTWTEGQAHARAQVRLGAILAGLDEIGVHATGEVGDGNPVDALSDALRGRHYDEVLVSRRGRSRIMRHLTAVVAKRFGVLATEVRLPTG
jgi:GABA permease